MLDEPTLTKLKSLRLDAMAAAWAEPNADATKLGIDERFGLLVDAEWLHRENKRIGRCLKEAKLRLSQACVEDIDYPARGELDRAVVRQLATCRWVEEHQTSSSPAPPEPARPLSPAPSHSKHAARVIAPSTDERRGYSKN